MSHLLFQAVSHKFLYDLSTASASSTINGDNFLSIIHRRGGALPDGVSVVGGTLAFGRALRMNDSGVYECVVKNNVGAGKAEYTLTVTGECKELHL